MLNSQLTEVRTSCLDTARSKILIVESEPTTKHIFTTVTALGRLQPA